MESKSAEMTVKSAVSRLHLNEDGRFSTGERRHGRVMSYDTMPIRSELITRSRHNDPTILGY